MPNATRKLGTVAPMPQLGGSRRSDEVDPPPGPGREQPLVESEPGDPRSEETRAPRGRLEHVLGRVVRSRGQPVGEQDREERDEHGAEEEQEALVAREVEDERARRRDRDDGDHEQRLRRARHGVLQRDRSRVRVRERLVGLRHEQREQRDDRGEAAGDDGRGQGGGIAEVAREHEHRAEREQPGVRDEVPDAGPGERSAPRGREARVVGRVRDPRDRDADDDVGALPDAETALAVGVPDRRQVGAVERPPREVEEGERHGPDGEAADEAPDEADRPEEREDEGDGPEDERPQPLRLEPEELVRERGGGRRDDEQLERRPADSLHDVDARREAATHAGRAARA